MYMTAKSLSLYREDNPDQVTLKFDDHSLALKHLLVFKRRLPAANASQPTLKVQYKDTQDLKLNAGLATERIQASLITVDFSFPAAEVSKITARWASMKSIIDTEISRLSNGEMPSNPLNYTAP
jgi:capsule polysaccharide export protein KpsE/RkpR